MGLQSNLTDAVLIEKISKYLLFDVPFETRFEVLSKRFENWKNSIVSDNFYIPVVGVQGCGKSTFLNALFMDDIILPVDANETTSVPIEIVYSNEKNNTAQAYLEDGKVIDVEFSESGLSEYVHNDKNPSNIKKVALVKLFVNDELLKKGLVLVDLPGFGSVTEGNQQTTINYLNNSVGMISMLRTTPPITKSESVMINSLLPNFKKVFLVQNRWNDESLDDCEEGKLHNLSVLKSLIKNEDKINKLEIDLINIYSALTTKLKSEIGKSSEDVEKFKEKLSKFAENWKAELEENIKAGLIEILYEADKIIDLQKKSLNEEKEIFLKQLSKDREEYIEEYNDKQKELGKISEEMKEQLNNLISSLEKLINDSKETFISKIKIEINSGITNSEHAQIVFDDIKAEITESIFSQAQYMVSEYFEAIKDRISNSSFNDLTKVNYNYDVKISEALRLDDVIEPLASVIFGTATYFVIAGSSLGPIGTVAGLIAGGLIGFFIGRKAKQVIVEDRAKKIIAELMPVIDRYIDDIKETLNKSVREYDRIVKKIINDDIEKNKNEFTNIENILKDNVEKSENEKNEMLKILVNDNKYLTEYIAMLKE